MLRFISFGSGSSGNSYLLESSEDSILIDSGVGYRKMKKYFAAYGVNCEKIRAIIVTHDHTDHISAVSSMAIYLRVPVLATSIVHHRISTNYRIHTKIPSSQVRIVEKYMPVAVGGFTVEAFDVPHDSADCSGYTITYGDRNFVIVTDCGHITDEIERRANAADYLVLETNYDQDMLDNGPYPYLLRKRISSAVGHLSNSAAADFLSTHSLKYLKHLFLCHLSENNNTLESVKDAIDNVMKGRDVRYDILERHKVCGFFELE